MPAARVLVTYAWVRSSLAVIRNLARHGLEVYAGDHQDIFMSRVSRYVTGWVKYPHYSSDPDGFVDTLVRFCAEKGITTYLPSHEEGLVVAKRRHRFPDSVRIPLAPYETLNRMHNKRETERIAAETHVPFPSTFTFENRQDYENKKRLLPAAGIFKQVYGHGSHGVGIYHDPEQRDGIWARMSAGVEDPAHLPLVQELLQNKRIYAASLVAHEGKVFATFVRRNLREKEPFGGACVKCESVLAPDLVDHCTRIVRHMGFTGVAMFEFLVDEKTRQHWLMDINPRYWGTSSHEFDCGVEYPWMQYCLLNGLPFAEHPAYPEGLKSRWIVGDVISWLKSRPTASNQRENLVRYLDFDDDFFMDFKLDDPLPFFVEAYLYFKFRKQILKQ